VVADETVTVSARASVRVGRRRLRLVASQERAGRGQRVQLSLIASPATRRALRRAVRRRRLYVVSTIIAVDDAGNSSSLRLPRVRLRR
jgi:hypothetical protein